MGEKKGKEKTQKAKEKHGSQHKRVILRVEFSTFSMLLVKNNNMLLVNVSM